MRRATLTAVIVIATVLTALAGVAVSQRSQHPAQLVAASADPGHPGLNGWKTYRPTPPTTVPPPPVTAPQRPVGATVSRGTAHRATPAPRPGGGPCDRPSTCPQLRQCENGGSYGAGTNPHFYGAYQFADRSTWGMSQEQQDAHADQMYAQRGAQPWPVCGKYLR